MNYEHGVERNTFALFPRLPPELRCIIWEMALRERHGSLHVVTWAQDGMFEGRTDCASYGPFDVSAAAAGEPCALSREPQTARMKPGTAVRSPSALSLVCREARAAVLARNRDRDLLRPLLRTRNRAGTRTLLVAAALAPADMLYVPDAPDVTAAFATLRNQPYAAGLERLAVTIIGMRTACDEGYFTEGVGIAGDGFVDAVRALPRLREVYLVVGGLPGGEFGTGLACALKLPPAAANECSVSTCGCPINPSLPGWRRCGCHYYHSTYVASHTSLREHVRAQRDDGFGFSAWEDFAARWRCPLVSAFRVDGNSSGPITAPFLVCSPDFEDYCQGVRDRVREVARGLGRRIDVRLMVDLDGQLLRPEDTSSSSLPPPSTALYSRSDVNFKRLNPGSWWHTVSRTCV